MKYCPCSMFPYPNRHIRIRIKIEHVKNVRSIPVVRLRIRLSASINNVGKKMLSKPFYPNADDVRTSFGKIMGLKVTYYNCLALHCLY